MDHLEAVPADTKEVFAKYGMCSHTFFFLLNRAFGHPKETEELASDPLAGGMMNTGNQCGMLWGAALAAGAESHRRYSDPGKAVAAAITTTRFIIGSFTERTKTSLCREITCCDLSTFTGMIKMMFRSFRHGMKNSPCFNLAEQWAPDAIESADRGLSAEPGITGPSRSCASEVVNMMGGSNEEMVMAAGFAGGLGLSGQACGALGAAIWMNTLRWCRENPGEKPPYFRNPDTKRIIRTFYRATGNEILCSRITGKSFSTVDEHTEFIRNGGCANLLNALAGPGRA